VFRFTCLICSFPFDFLESAASKAQPRCPGRVSSSCSTSDTRRVNLVTYPVISHERGKDREVLTTSETYPWSFGTQIFRNGLYLTCTITIKV
jgi:hypothetical protein